MDQNQNQEYGAEQIQILEGLEAVRKRPGMYIGSTSARGLHHLVYEIVDNAVDEALAGVCTEINVFINKDGSVTVRDNGRGIPVEINEKKGISTVEVVFTILHAGGKFGGGGYKVSGGLHGVGASVVNALSDWLVVVVEREGHKYEQRYERGKPVTELKRIGDSDRLQTLEDLDLFSSVFLVLILIHSEIFLLLQRIAIDNNDNSENEISSPFDCPLAHVEDAVLRGARHDKFLHAGARDDGLQIPDLREKLLLAVAVKLRQDIV